LIQKVYGFLTLVEYFSKIAEILSTATCPNIKFGFIKNKNSSSRDLFTMNLSLSYGIAMQHPPPWRFVVTNGAII
jgi:hypothetical protein